MDCVSSCNIYAVQQDTQRFLMIEYSSHVSSTCFGPHRSIFGSVLYKLYVQIWYVVICVLPDTSSRYKVVGRTASYNFVTAGHVEQYTYHHIPNLHIQSVKNTPEDGPVRSETCRANMWWINSIIKKLCVSCWTAYILQNKIQSKSIQGLLFFMLVDG